MNLKTLTFQEQDRIGVLTINRPEALNALNRDVFSDLDVFCASIHKTNVRCVIITGSGDKAFVAGADIKEMDTNDASYGFNMVRRGQQAFDKISNLPVPVIAAVNGFALGGGLELAMACDFIIASTKAKFGLPEVTLGLIPGYGGTQRLARCVGVGTARMITLTGGIYGAEQALNWGLVGELTAPDALMAKAVERAQTIASRSQSALSLARQSINEGFDTSLAEGQIIESNLFQNAFESEDKQEGIAAFIDKRKPNFK